MNKEVVSCSTTLTKNIHPPFSQWLNLHHSSMNSEVIDSSTTLKSFESSRLQHAL